MKITKYARSLQCKLITGYFVWFFMKELPVGAMAATGNFGVQLPPPVTAPTVLTAQNASVAPAATPAAPSGQSKSQEPVVACGPVCWILILFAIGAVVVTIIVGLIKLCRLLNHPHRDPDDPADGDKSNWMPIQSLQQNATLNSRSSLDGNSNSLINLTLDDRTYGQNDTRTNAWDISDYTTNGVDGVANSPFHDEAGNPYVVLFAFSLVTSTNLGVPADQWCHECDVIGYLSFTSTNAINPGTHLYNSSGQYPPQNVKMYWRTNGVLAAITYDSVTYSGSAYGLSGSMNLPYNSSTIAQAKFYRLEYPQQ